MQANRDASPVHVLCGRTGEILRSLNPQMACESKCIFVSVSWRRHELLYGMHQAHFSASSPLGSMEKFVRTVIIHAPSAVEISLKNFVHRFEPTESLLSATSREAKIREDIVQNLMSTAVVVLGTSDTRE